MALSHQAYNLLITTQGKKKIIKPVIFQNNKLKLLLQTLVENMLQFALMFLSERSVIR